MLVVVAGKLDQSSSLTSLIEEKFGGMDKGELEPYETAASYGQPESRHFKKKTEQAHFYMGVPALSITDPRRWALQKGTGLLRQSRPRHEL